MKKVLVFLLAICMVILFLTGCTGNQANSSEPEKSTDAAAVSTATEEKTAEKLSETGMLNLVWSAANGTDSLFECPWMDLQSLYHDMVFSTLIKTDGIGRYVPKLASKWAISDDGLTYTLTLNDKVKWHDGTPFTQEDVLFSINTALQYAKFRNKTGLSVIEGAKAVIDGQAKEVSGINAKDGIVTIKLTAPDNSLLDTLCSFVILPKHLLKDADPATIDTYEAFWKKPVGTGAYKIDEVSFPNYFTVVRNDDYFGPKAGIKKALFTSYATGGDEAIVAAAIAGKVDFAFGNAINDINTVNNVLKQNPDMQYIMMPSTYTRWFWFNTAGSTDDKYNTFIKKPEVRQALSLLIDKETIASFYAGQAVALSTLVNPEHSAYNSDIPLFKRDVDKAKQMLTDAGFDFSKTLRILYYYKDQTTLDIMELIKQNFAEAGVKVEPFLAEGDLASLIYEKRNYDMIYAAGGDADPIKSYNLLIPSGSQYDKIFAEQENRMQFKELLGQYKATNDSSERKKLGDRIQVLGNQLCYVTGVYSLNKIVMYNSAHLQLDLMAFTADLQDLRDNHFENWKLLSK